MSDEELAVKLVDHAVWMVGSGQYRGTVSAYLGYLRYRNEATKTAALAEWERRETQPQP